MPVTPTYPGVYIEEVPSGVRTITGVATSITAFIGRTARGPDNDPVIINNWGDFERHFGGLSVNYPLSYSVRNFFGNGGSQAIIVRLYQAPEDDSQEYAQIDANGLSLQAAYKGVWGNNLRVRVDHNVSTEMPWVAAYGLEEGDLFNLTVHDTDTQVTESFSNMTVQDSPRQVNRVLENQSNLVRLEEDATLPEDIPDAHDELTAENSRNIWTDDALSSPVSTEAEAGALLGNSAYTDSRAAKTGIYALEKADLFNLLCIPPDVRSGDTSQDVYSAALEYCVERRAMLIVDPPVNWNDVGDAYDGVRGESGDDANNITLSGLATRNAALYFPRVIQSDPLRENQLDTFAPCGLVAGAMARTDVQRGVWKAPAGIDVSLNRVRSLSVKMTDEENGILNPLGVNCLRSFPIIGNVIWGARTLRGADLLADEYKYVPVRRLALFIEESLYRGTQWVVFEPNDEPLWAQIRLNVGAFMHNLFRQGAFQGTSPREAYLVKCDGETTSQNDINLGIVNIVVGFAPLKPAEFVIIKIQQLAGQVET